MEEFNHFEEIFQQMDADLNKLVRKTGFDAERIAKEESRVDTGSMRNGWYVRTEDSSAYRTLPIPAGHDMEQFPDVPAPEHNTALLVNSFKHTIFNEYGTTHMPAKPMAGPAIEQVRGPFLAAVKQIVRA